MSSFFNVVFSISQFISFFSKNQVIVSVSSNYIQAHQIFIE